MATNIVWGTFPSFDGIGVDFKLNPFQCEILTVADNGGTIIDKNTGAIIGTSMSIDLVEAALSNFPPNQINWATLPALGGAPDFKVNPLGVTQLTRLTVSTTTLWLSNASSINADLPIDDVEALLEN